MNNKIITIIIVGIILVLAGSIIYFKNFQSSTVQDTEAEKVAKWIGEHSVLYVQTGCIHCKEQEDLFGINLRFLNIVNCLENPQECIDIGIEGTPTWMIDGQRYERVQSVEKLKELTGYQD